MGGLLFGVYRPPLAFPGIPGIDFVVGRTSTNTLSVGLIPLSLPVAGVSSTSVTIGTGSKVFTVDASKLTPFNVVATNRIGLASAANSTNFLKGTVTSLVGSTLTINVPVGGTGGSGAFTDWELIEHLPPQCAYDAAATGIRTGSATSDFSIIDWDFRGLDSCFYLQQTKTITFSQCLFDLTNYVTDTNVPFMANRSGAPPFIVQNCTFNGANSTLNVTKCLGGTCILCEYSDFQAWPMDWADLNPVAGTTTNIRFNRVVITSSTLAAYGLHADGMQSTSWTTGIAFNIYNNNITMLTPPPGGSGVSFVFNIGAATGDWTAPTSIHDNIIGGGAFNIAAQQNSGHVNTSSISFTNNYCSDGIFGIFYTTGTTVANITVDAFRSTTTGAAQTFSYTDSGGGAHNNVTSIP